MFHVGQKVVCVGGSSERLTDEERALWAEWRSYWRVSELTRGAIYTVRETRWRKDGSQGIRLVEVVNPLCLWRDAPPQEPWYHASDFRPVAERKTDISIFKAMLNPAQPEVVS